MGFEPQIMRIVQNVRPDRQTVMFSATFPRAVETVARNILVDPLEIQVGGRSVVNPDIEQVVEIRPENDRFLRLLEVRVPVRMRVCMRPRVCNVCLCGHARMHARAHAHATTPDARLCVRSPTCAHARRPVHLHLRMRTCQRAWRAARATVVERTHVQSKAALCIRAY
eukprot:355627-Chlamydomonas_euryale.AAC.6